jgi:hypothetical protein
MKYVKVQTWPYLLTDGAEPFLRSYQLCSHSRTSQHFMEPEGSLLCSQEPSPGPLSWARSIQSILSHPTSLRSTLILSNHLHLGLPSGLFPSGFSTNIVHKHSSSPHSCYMPCPFLLHKLLTYWAEPLLRICQLCNHSTTSLHFMKPEGSLQTWPTTMN